MIETSVGKRIDVVFDVYLNDSIKNIKRVENRRATTILHFIQILPSNKMAIVSERSWKQKSVDTVPYYRVKERNFPQKSSK